MTLIKLKFMLPERNPCWLCWSSTNPPIASVIDSNERAAKRWYWPFSPIYVGNMFPTTWHYDWLCTKSVHGIAVAVFQCPGYIQGFSCNWQISWAAKNVSKGITKVACTPLQLDNAMKVAPGINWNVALTFAHLATILWRHCGAR